MINGLQKLVRGAYDGDAYQYGRWILVDGYDAVIDDPTCVSIVYDDFLGGANSVNSYNSGMIGNTGFATLRTSVSSGSIKANDPNGGEAQGYIRITTGAGISDNNYIFYGQPDGTLATGQIKLKPGTIWECMVRVPVLAPTSNSPDGFRIFCGISYRAIALVSKGNLATLNGLEFTNGADSSEFAVGFLYQGYGGISNGSYHYWQAGSGGRIASVTVEPFSNRGTSAITAGEWMHLKMIVKSRADTAFDVDFL
jgi:hypothetical protein